jgi:tRNA (guanine37-N1)-methyltransferase
MMVSDLERVDQWCLRIPLKNGEKVRQMLINEGVLDRTLKPKHEGETILFPITDWRERAERCQFDPNSERLDLPRHELIGGIAVMQEHDVDGAKRILTSRPSLHTVLFPTSEIGGQYRTRTFEVLAGTPTTRTQYIEYGHRFTIDLSTAYFSARLATERQRIVSLVEKDERVLDLFAGVGPFAISLADRAMIVVASDINPNAVSLMLENILQNRTRNVMAILADAKKLADIIPWKFDRVIMNFPINGLTFLPIGFNFTRKGGSIHFYALISKENEHQDRIIELGGEIVTERFIRSYSPTQWHTVYDIRKKE